MKKLVYTNNNQGVFQIKENTPYCNAAKSLVGSVNRNHYLINWLIANSLRNGEFAIESK